ncbi:MAG: M23 family metallopeptidase [bacterium]|nr:M23 family metallopeptidase [bacterium]
MLVQLCVLVCLTADPIATSFTWPVSPREDYDKAQEVFDFFPGHGYHFGEDWNLKIPPGENVNSDMGKPVYCIAKGKVVRVDNTNDSTKGWGKIIVVAHTLPNLEIVYSVYAHLQKILVQLGDQPVLGQQIGTIGNANGYYTAARGSSAHLHFAIMKRGPFPPKVRAYEQPLKWDTIDDYYIPTLFISNRLTPVTIKLNSGGWKKFSVDAQTPVSTAYVEVTSLLGNKQYYSLAEALSNGTLRPVIKYYWWGILWDEIGIAQLENFIFLSEEGLEYTLRSNLSSVAYTVKLVIFPILADEKMMALRAKSDILMVGSDNSQKFTSPKAETFWVTPVMIPSFPDQIDFWLSWIEMLTLPGYHGPSYLYQATYYDSRPLLGRFVSTNEYYPSIFADISPNKVD